jgi:hypothetical protein
MKRRKHQYYHQKKHLLASLQSIELYLRTKIAPNLDSYHQLQLNKGIINLRKVARDKNIGKGLIISKEDFDRNIKHILHPFLPLNDSFHVAADGDDGSDGEAAAESEQAKEWKEKMASLFTTDPDKTLQRVIDDNNELEAKNKKSYESWLQEKKIQQQDKERYDVSPALKQPSFLYCIDTN